MGRAIFRGGNTIDKIHDVRRIAADNNPFLIAMMKKLQTGWLPPKNISKEQAKYVRENKDKFPNWFVGWVGFGICGFGGKFFGGYVNSSTSRSGRDYISDFYNNITKQIKNLMDVELHCCDYKNLVIPDNSVVYCDPPYQNTTGYTTGSFNHEKFWQKIIPCHSPHTQKASSLFNVSITIRFLLSL